MGKGMVRYLQNKGFQLKVLDIVPVCGSVSLTHSTKFHGKISLPSRIIVIGVLG